MPDSDDIIDETVVRVTPDLTGFRKNLTAQLKKAVVGVEAPVRLTANATGWAASVRKALAAVTTTPTAKVGLQADASGWATSVRTALAKHPQATAKVKLVADARDLDKATARTGAGGGGGGRGGGGRGGGGGGLSKFLAQDTYGPKIIDLGGSGIRPMNLLAGAVAAMTPALFAMGASAVQASTSVAALGAAGIGAAAGLTAVITAFGSVTEAAKLREQIRKQNVRSAAQAAEQEKTYLDSIRAATLAVASAERSLRDSIRAEADAERDVADAQRGVTEARREAAEAVANLREEIEDLALAERDAVLSVEEARNKQAEVTRNFFATDLERRRAALNVQKAIDRRDDARREGREKKRELNERVAGGIENSPEVRRARERRRDALQRRDDRRADTPDARDALKRAERELAARRAGGVKGGTGADSAEAELAEMRRKMSPAARAMDDWFAKNEGMFGKLRRQMESAVLPGFLTFLEQITRRGEDGRSALSLMADSAADLGEEIGDAVGRIGVETTKPWFRKAMDKINAENKKSFKLLGDAAVVLMRPVMTILASASPLFTRFSKAMLGFATWFDEVIQKAEKNGSLKRWFDEAGDSMGRIVELGKSIIRFVTPIFAAALPSGDTLISRLTTFFDNLAKWSNSPEGMKQIGSFFDKFAKLDYARIASMLAQLTVTIAAFKLIRMTAKHPFLAMFALLTTINPELTEKILGYITGFIVDTMGWIERNPGAASTMLAVLLAAGAIKKGADIGLKLPGIEGFLTGKFKWLDKVLNNSKTGIMTVHAGVVNVMGGVKGGAPAPGGKPPPGGVPPVPVPLPGGRPAPVAPVTNLARLGGLLTKLGAFATALVSLPVFAVVAGTGVVMELTGQPYNWDPVSDAQNMWASFKKTLQEEAAGATWEELAPVRRYLSTTLPDSINPGSGSNGQSGWSGVGKRLADGLWLSFSLGSKESWPSRIMSWASSFVGWFKDVFGINSPSTVFASLGASLANGMWGGFAAMWNGMWANLNAIMVAPVRAALNWIDVNLIDKANAALSAFPVPGIPHIGGAPGGNGKFTPIPGPRIVGGRTFDNGGKLPPGLTLAMNGTGKDETIRTAEQEKALHSGSVRLDRRDLAALAQTIITALSHQQIRIDGRKVAEIIQGYDYLPQGM